MLSRLGRSGLVVRRWWRLSGLLFLLSVSLFHLHGLLLVLSLHLLHLSRVGRLLRHALVVLFLLLLKLLVLLLLLRVHLLLALLVFPFPFRICIIRIARVAGRSGSLMRREILCMDRSRRTRNIILWTCDPNPHIHGRQWFSNQSSVLWCSYRDSCWMSHSVSVSCGCRLTFVMEERTVLCGLSMDRMVWAAISANKGQRGVRQTPCP